MRQVVLRLLPALLAMLVSASALAGEVQVAVAANFTAPMKRIAEEFQRETGHKVLLSFAATGKLYAQITNGAPFDIFLAADDVRPAKLEKAGGAVVGSRFTYATGRLVLWSAKPGMVDERGGVLKAGTFKHLAMASPKLAPYGAAAVETLNGLGVFRALEPKLVLGESIGQTYGFIKSGNADLGFVALSQVVEDGKVKSGSVWIVPDKFHNPIRQDAVLLTRARNNKAAADLLAFLKTEKAKALIRSYGYHS